MTHHHQKAPTSTCMRDRSTRRRLFASSLDRINNEVTWIDQFFGWYKMHWKISTKSIRLCIEAYTLIDFTMNIYSYTLGMREK